MPSHAVVWIDHKQARVFHLDEETAHETTVLSPEHRIHRHPKGRGEAREHPDDGHRFLAGVARTLDGVDAVLIVGPSSAKLELAKHLRAHGSAPESRTIDVETADHPTDGELVARGRRHFNVERRA
jgi:hypothetical protein